MRIGAVGNQGVGVIGHQLRQRGVQVEHCDDGDIGPQPLAHAGQQFALAIIGVLRRHRAVEMQQHAIDAVAGRNDQAGKTLEGLGGDAARRVGASDQRMDQRPAKTVGGLERRAHRAAGAAKGLRNFVVAVDAVRLEGLDTRQLHTERVRLVHEFRNEHARCHGADPSSLSILDRAASLTGASRETTGENCIGIVHPASCARRFPSWGRA